jgi:UDP-glucose 4-epimerase
MRILIIGGCGYIGSRLFCYLKDHEVDTLDLEWFGNKVNRRNYRMDYRHADESFLGGYDVVILLAGHSSVQMCEHDRNSSFNNNVSNFINLLNKLKKQRFIYMSSSSVYCSGVRNREDDIKYVPKNYYDLTKRIIDYYATLSRLDYYGLRLGTVCGHSKNLRIDLMINKMYENAITSKIIDVYNPTINRPILGIEDLCRAIEKIINSPSTPGIYNLASLNATVGEIANVVAAKTGASLNVKEGPLSYDFSIDTDKFQSIFSFSFLETLESITESLSQDSAKGVRGRMWHYV